jgi:hypothetical protein
MNTPKANEFGTVDSGHDENDECTEARATAEEGGGGQSGHWEEDGAHIGSQEAWQADEPHNGLPEDIEVSGDGDVDEEGEEDEPEAGIGWGEYSHK